MEEFLYRVPAGDAGALPQLFHDAGCGPDFVIRRRRVGEHYEAWLHRSRRIRASLDEPEEDAIAAPCDVEDKDRCTGVDLDPEDTSCLIPSYAPRLASTAAPAQRDKDQASPRIHARPSEEARVRQRRAAASSRPTTPASPRRPRRRRATTPRHGTLRRTGRVSLDETESKVDGSTSNGDDTSVVVQIGKPANGGTVIGVGGVANKALADVFLAEANRRNFMARIRLAVQLGPMYWVHELTDWVYMLMGSTRYRERDFWSWLGVVGDPIQNNDDTCSICATLVCLEARHRLDFERRYGFNKFPFYITAAAVADLKNQCTVRGVWTPLYGAHEEGVLRVIQAMGGAEVANRFGWKPCKLQVKSWECHSNRDHNGQAMRQSEIAKLIQTKGPLLGTILVHTESYYAPGWEDRVYRGKPRGTKGNGHLVVCTSYRYHPTGRVGSPTELHIEVVDNHTRTGPVRWILAIAFTRFFVVHVEPLNAREVRPSLWRRLLNTILRIFRLAGHY